MKRQTETLKRAVTAKVTESEWKQIERLRSESGITRSEWCRIALLAQLNVEPSNTLPHESSDMAFLLAELLAFRTITLNLLYSVGSGERVSRDQMDKLIELADREKFRRAVERLRQRKK